MFQFFFLRFFLFTNKTSAYLAGNNIKEILKIYTQELKALVTWLNAIKLSLNTDKSNFTLFGGPRRNIKHNITIKINNVEIKEKEYTKHIGVLIVKGISWFHHIKHANRKVSKGIGILTKLRQFVSKDVLLKLLFAFIQPHLDYGLLIWSTAHKNIKPVNTNVKDIF